MLTWDCQKYQQNTPDFSASKNTQILLYFCLFQFSWNGEITFSIFCLIGTWRSNWVVGAAAFPGSFLSAEFESGHAAQAFHVILCLFNFHKIDSTWRSNSQILEMRSISRWDVVLLFFLCQLWNVCIAGRGFKQLKKLAHLYVVWLSIKYWGT